jgi:8-amino-7-oxononanoate synthase
MFEQALKARLKEHEAKDLYRQRQPLSSPQQVEITLNGKNAISFCSNDYLGLANHPEIIAAYKEGADHYGVGSGASHLICGHSDAHRNLENAFAKFLGRERALLFNNGYMANLGVLQALVQEPDVVYQDKLNHASLIDAGQLCKGKMQRYAHNNLEHLQILMEQQTKGHKFIVTDGVFSMSGDLAPLPKLVAIAKAQGAYLIVDDAHGIGVLGEGRGVLAHFNLSQEDVPVLICPLGKAFGGFGAIVAGSATLIESLIQFARTYIYTTAIPPALACALQKSLELVQTDHARRTHLASLITYFKAQAKKFNLNFLESSTPIQSFMVGDAKATLNLQSALLEKGILVSCIRPPTVLKNTSRLRITLSVLHQKEHVDFLFDILIPLIRHFVPPSPARGEGKESAFFSAKERKELIPSPLAFDAVALATDEGGS